MSTRNPQALSAGFAGLENQAEALLVELTRGTSPSHAPAGYVLARCLCLAKALRMIASNVVGEQRVVVFESLQSGKVFSIVEQNLGDAEFDGFHRELIATLKGERLARKPEPAAAAPAAHVPRRRPAEDCKPLIQAATRFLYRSNAFRVTGLAVDATTRDVTRHADKLRQLEELDQGPAALPIAFALQPPPTRDQVREAIQKLKDPELRIIDEFFWFWPEEFGKSRADPAIQALLAGDSDTAQKIWAAKETNPQEGPIALHNMAVLWHLTALEQELISAQADLDGSGRERLAEAWRTAFTRWESLMEDDPFWDKVSLRIRQLDDPRLSTGFARRMRGTLPEAFDKINAELALDYAERGNLDLAKFHVQFRRETQPGRDNVAKTAELVLTPERTRLKEQIRRAQQRAAQNPSEGAAAALDLLEQARRSVVLFDLFFGNKSELRIELFDEVATVCNFLLVAYHKATRDASGCLEALSGALSLATSTELRRQIEQNLSTLTGPPKAAGPKAPPAPVYALLNSIQASKDHPRERLARFRQEVVPALTCVGSNYALFDSAALVLREICVAAWNLHQDRVTASNANELALYYARHPTLKQRLADDEIHLLQAVARQLDPSQPSPIPLPTSFNWNEGGPGRATAGQARPTPARRAPNQAALGCSIAAGFLILLGLLRSCSTADTSPRPNPYSVPPTRQSSPFQRPNSSPPSAPRAPRPAQTPFRDSNATPPSIFPESNSSPAAAYQVPSVYTAELTRDRDAMAKAKATAERLQAELTRLKLEVESDRPLVDQTSQTSIDGFNSKLRRYNALVQAARTQTRTLNQMVESYNEKLRRYGIGH